MYHFNCGSCIPLRPYPKCDGSSQPHECETEITFAPTFASALIVSPSRSRFIVSLPKEEKVKTAENADKNESSCFRRKCSTCLSKLREKTDHEAAYEIDSESSEGKINASTRGLSPRTEKVSHDRTKGAAEGDQIILNRDGIKWRDYKTNKRTKCPLTDYCSLITSNYPPSLSFNQSRNPFSCGLTEVPRLSASFSNSSLCSFVNLAGISTLISTNWSPRGISYEHAAHLCLSYERLSRLRSRGNFQFLIAIQCWHLHFRTQDGLRNIDIKVQQNIILAAFEELMRLTSSTRNRLPFGPPNTPGPPSPFKRICVPTSTPAGICTFFLMTFRSSPPRGRCGRATK